LAIFVIARRILILIFGTNGKSPLQREKKNQQKNLEGSTHHDAKEVTTAA
jgi:hypothetical protein